MLNKGEVQAIGTTKEVCEQYLARRYQSNISITPQFGDNKKSAGNSVSSAPSDDQLEQRCDMRMAFINNSNLKNDIQVFEFSSVRKSFGKNGATITYAGLEDLDGKKLSWMVGGDMARIVVEATVLVECKNLIFGFNVKDKLGQVLFAQNTYVDTCMTPVSAKPWDIVGAIFLFRLPILPRGSYAVDVAVADGTLLDAIQLQWAHNAFVLESQTSSVMYGLIGLSFHGIELRNRHRDMANEA